MVFGLIGLCKGTTKCLVGAILVSVVLAFSFSGLALGIADIVIGAKWKSCYLNDDNADIYLIVSGSIQLAGFLIYSNDKKTSNENNNGSMGLCGLILTASISVLIWGMTIVWDTEKGNCDSGQYDYLYYRTIVAMFIEVVLFILLTMYTLCVYTGI